jgi:beta-glucosidase
LRALRGLAAPGTAFHFDDGSNPAEAAKAAAGADLALIFVTQWMTEGQDSLTLSLPAQQDALVYAVAAANPNTIVVLETGGPVDMPWSDKVKGIVEAWYPGIGGGEAIARVLYGRVNASGKLPVTFAARDADLPHPQVTGLTPKTGNNGMDASTNHGEQAHDFTVDYNIEGMMVGYRWFQAKDKQPLFPFGYGLSYTRFAYSGLTVSPGGASVSFDVDNTGQRDGDEVAEIYVTLPGSAGEPFRKLAGWTRVTLAAGAHQAVTVPIDPLYLSIFSAEKNAWERPAGEYTLEVGGSSASLPLHQSFTLAATAATSGR